MNIIYQKHTSHQPGCRRKPVTSLIWGFKQMTTSSEQGGHSETCKEYTDFFLNFLCFLKCSLLTISLASSSTNSNKMIYFILKSRTIKPQKQFDLTKEKQSTQYMISMNEYMSAIFNVTTPVQNNVNVADMYL